MSHSISPVESSDIPSVSDLIVDSLIDDGIQEYAAATWPELNTTAGRTEARSRLLSTRMHLSEPSHFLKVVNDTTGDIVACSICIHSSKPPKTLSGLPGNAWKNDGDREYAQHLRAERNNLLLRVFAQMEGPVTEVVTFFVNPPSQRQGIGSMLLKHLINQNAPQSIPLVLIANPTAEGFYHKLGFTTLEDCILPVEEKWRNKAEARLISMKYTM